MTEIDPSAPGKITREIDNVAAFMRHRSHANGRLLMAKTIGERPVRIDSLFATMPLGVLYRDSNGIIIDANPAAERLLGISLVDLLGRIELDDSEPRLGIVHEDGSELPFESQPSVIAVSTGFPVKNMIVGVIPPTTNETRWLRVSATPEFAAGSSMPFQVYTTFEDITEHRRAEQEVRERSNQISMILENTTELFASFDRRWRCTFINGQAAKVAVRPREEMLGRNIWDLFPQSLRSATEGKLLRAMEERVAVEFTGFIEDLGVWLELRTYPTEDGLALCGHDITERINQEEALRQEREALRQSEARLAEAQSVAHVGSWELDLITGARAWSDELYRMLGLDPTLGPPDAALHRACYHPDDYPRHAAALKELLETGKPSALEARIVRPGGEIRWLRMKADAVLDDNGSMVRVVGTAADVTDLFASQQALRESHESLIALADERESLLTETERLLAEARERADLDPLTNLLNHRSFHSLLRDETDKTAKGGEPVAVAMLDLDNFKFFNDVYGHSVGDDVLKMVAERLRQACGPLDTVARFGGDEFAMLLPEVGTSSALEMEASLRARIGKLSYRPDQSGTVIPITVSVGAAIFAGGEQDRHEVVRQADQRLLRSKTGGDIETEVDHMRTEAAGSVSGFSMLDALVTAVDNKDRYTRKHSEDVTMYSLMIARQLGLSKRDQHTVAMAGLLHDVGKIGVPDAILRKPGKLTPEEFAAIKQHPQMGAIMVASVAGLEDTLDAVRHHHERWDGDGYPFGLRGTETPLFARMTAVADAYSAMTTDRPYRTGMGRPKAINILQDGAGSQWDPECVQAFIAALG